VYATYLFHKPLFTILTVKHNTFVYQTTKMQWIPQMTTPENSHIIITKFL